MKISSQRNSPLASQLHEFSQGMESFGLMELQWTTRWFKGSVKVSSQTKRPLNPFFGDINCCKKMTPKKMGPQIHCQDTGGWSLKGCCPTFTIIAPLSQDTSGQWAGHPPLLASLLLPIVTQSRRLACPRWPPWWWMIDGGRSAQSWHCSSSNFCPGKRIGTVVYWSTALDG